MTQALLISEARELFATKSGKLIHIHTIRRWIAKGIRKNGQVVRLRSEREGVRLVTRPEWVEDFKRELSGERMEPSQVTPRISGPTAADRFLMAEGLYEASRKVPNQDMSAGRRRVRPLPQVLPRLAAGKEQGRGDNRGTDRAEDAQAKALQAAE